MIQSYSYFLFLLGSGLVICVFLAFWLFHIGCQIYWYIVVIYIDLGSVMISSLSFLILEWNVMFVFYLFLISLSRDLSILSLFLEDHWFYQFFFICSLLSYQFLFISLLFPSFYLFGFKLLFLPHVLRWKLGSSILELLF